MTEPTLNLHAWIQTFPGSITVCDPQGIILELNARAAETFHSDGGYDLIGRNLFDCHPPEARQMVAQLMQAQQRNVYTTERQGVKSLVYQTPWYHVDGSYGGFLEIILQLPAEMPHFIRG